MNLPSSHQPCVRCVRPVLVQMNWLSWNAAADEPEDPSPNTSLRKPRLEAFALPVRRASRSPAAGSFQSVKALSPPRSGLVSLSSFTLAVAPPALLSPGVLVYVP